MTKANDDLSNVADTKELLIRDLRKLEARAKALGMPYTQNAIKYAAEQSQSTRNI